MILSLQGMAHNIFVDSSPDDIQANTTNQDFGWKLRGFDDFRFAVTHTHVNHGAATVKYYQSSTLQENYGYMDLGIAERWVYEYEDTMTIHLDRFHKRIMQHALSRHTLSIVTLRAMRSRKSGERLSTNLVWQIFHIPSQ
jgi:hypothetical protein